MGLDLRVACFHLTSNSKALFMEIIQYGQFSRFMEFNHRNIPFIFRGYGREDVSTASDED